MIAGPAAPSAEEVRHAIGLFNAGSMAQLGPVAHSLAQRYPQHSLGWVLLGSVLQAQGRANEALAVLQRVVELMPGKAEHLTHLGSAFHRLLRHEEAEVWYRRALDCQPAHVHTLLQLAQLHIDMKRLDEAERDYRAALEADPTHAQAHFSLAVILSWQERWVDAEVAYRRALALQPASALALDSLGHVLLEQGRPQEALACATAALALEPDSTALLANFLFTANYVAQPPSQDLAPEAARYSERMSAAAAGQTTAWRCEAQPRQLRVGLVSGDLRRHAVASFLESVLPHGATNGIEYFAYSTNALEDEVTARLRPHCVQWRSIASLGAAEAAGLIAADGIHVLMDLSGHSGLGRLDVFALAPAPVRVSWLGYPATTGLAQMDYLLTDPYCTAPGDERRFSERLPPLPETWFCYCPPDGGVPIAPPPVADSGVITFGSFNNQAKLNDAVVRTWAQILNAVPGARLYLRNRQLKDVAMRQSVTARFAACGVPAQRLILEGPIASMREHLAGYGGVDIALDPFPFVGGTTSIEALYMGVPVVTLRGQGHMLRLGESLARTLGLEDWIAADEAGYVARAVAAAAEPERLAALRAGLRGRMEHTALLDAPRFAKGFAATLWALWRAA
jgi:protein O-GlcNAc transferase